MRVKISYTVDLEEVPHKIQEIVKNSVTTVMSAFPSVEEEFSDNLLNKGNFQISIKNLGEMREILYKCDQQLEDCAQLLINLQKTSADLHKGVEGEENGEG